jgi:nitroreductase
MDTVTAIGTRRSIRDYEKRAVEEEIIAEILWMQHRRRRRL